MLKVVQKETESNADSAGVVGSLLDELVRDGARQMLAAALQAEVAAYVEAHVGEVNADGRRLVVRNGSHQARQVITAAGSMEVRQPRVSVSGSLRRSCRLGRGSLRGWRRCCRCSTCTACPA